MKSAASSLPIDLLIESTSGGSVRHVLDLFDELIERDHDVRLVVSMLRTDDLFMQRFEKIDPRRKVIINMRRSPHPSDVTAIAKLARNLRSLNHRRILHAHSTKAGLIATGVRPWTAGTLFTPHAYRGMDPELSIGKQIALGTVENLISRFHDRVFAVSPAELDYCKAIRLDAKRVKYIPNGVKIEEIAKIARSRHVPRLQADPVLGFVGRMTYQKNPMLFLRTVIELRKEFPKIRGIMLGDGPLLDGVRDFIKANGLAEAVEAVGHVNTLDRLLDMDIMVHTSIYESLPYVLLEACAVGLPVVSVRNAGSEAIFGKQMELVSDIQDAAALARACADLLRSPDALERASKLSRAAGEQFTIETMTNAIEEQYREVYRNAEPKR